MRTRKKEVGALRLRTDLWSVELSEDCGRWGCRIRNLMRQKCVNVYCIICNRVLGCCGSYAIVIVELCEKRRRKVRF